MTEQERQEMIAQMNKDKEGGSKKFWSPGSKEEGTFRIRFLPPMKQNGEKKFYFDHKVHFIGGIPYECLNQSFEDANGNYHEAEKCPVCHFVKRLYSTSERDSDEWKLAGQLKAKQRYISRVIVRDKENPEVPEYYEYGPSIWKKLYHIIVESDFGNILDPKNGRDFNLIKSGTGRNSNYDASTPAAEKSPIFNDSEKLKTALTKATEMVYNNLIEFSSKEEMKSALNEYLGMDNEEEETSNTKQQPKQEEDKDNKEMFGEESAEDNDDEGVEASSDELDEILGEFTD
jgi:hypothetical protein